MWVDYNMMSLCCLCKPVDNFVWLDWRFCFLLSLVRIFLDSPKDVTLYTFSSAVPQCLSLTGSNRNCVYRWSSQTRTGFTEPLYELAVIAWQSEEFILSPAFWGVVFFKKKLLLLAWFKPHRCLFSDFEIRLFRVIVFCFYFESF